MISAELFRFLRTLLLQDLLLTLDNGPVKSNLYEKVYKIFGNRCICSLCGILSGEAIGSGKPDTGLYKQVGGFIAIGKIFPGTWDWHAFWSMTAFLSIILAIMNIIPIPGLDGGHTLFTLWEMITRRKVSERVLEIAQYIGLFLLLALMLFANGNDIYRLFK